MWLVKYILQTGSVTLLYVVGFLGGMHLLGLVTLSLLSFTHLCGRLYFSIYHGRILWSGKLPNEVGETFSETSQAAFLFLST